MMFSKVALFIFILTFLGCTAHSLPTIRYNMFDFKKSHVTDNENLRVTLTNPVRSPIRVWVYSTNDSLQTLFNKLNPVLLEEMADSIISISDIKSFGDYDISYFIALGNPSKIINQTKIELPFPKKRQYRVIQGNDTDYTHNTDYSRFAIDFAMSVNDTVSSVSNGYVVGLIDQYKHGGKGSEWRSFGNYLTIYDPSAGIYYQYVHLTYNGSLVELGDEVKRGQAIALSGKTGQTDIEHLHFNSLIPAEGKAGLKSIPVEFVEGYRSLDLKRNDLVKK